MYKFRTDRIVKQGSAVGAPVRSTIPQSFSAGTVNSIQLEEETSGCISHDGTWGWVVSGPCLEIVDILNGGRIGQVFFDEAIVEHVVEVERLDTGGSLLAVSVDPGQENNLICLVDPTKSVIVSCISLQYRISALKSIDQPFLTSGLAAPLNDFAGIVAVGTADGRLLLLDMKVDDDMASSRWKMSDEPRIAKECSWGAAARSSHSTNPFVQLGGEFHSSSTFEFMFSNRQYQSLSNDDAEVTAIAYHPQTGTLCVGFSFGSIQLWSLRNPENPLYGRPFDSSSVGITHVAFDHPVDDPEEFLYVWVGRGAKSAENSDGPSAVLELYSIAFPLENSKRAYERSPTVSCQFQHILGWQQDFSSSASRIVSMQVRGKAGTYKYGEQDLETLLFLSWTRGNIDEADSIYVGVFDVNRISTPSVPQKSSFSVFRFDAAAAPILDLWVDPNSVSSFSVVARKTTDVAGSITEGFLDSAYWTNDNSFDIQVLYLHEANKVEFLGAQVHAMQQVVSNGPDALESPWILQVFQDIGLIDKSFTVNSPDEMRWIILDALFHYGHLENIHDYISIMGEQNDTMALKPVLEWLRKKFESSLALLKGKDSETFFKEWFPKLNSLLASVQSIIQHLFQSSYSSSTAEGRKNLNKQWEQIQTRWIHLQLAHWFMHHNLHHQQRALATIEKTYQQLADSHQQLTEVMLTQLSSDEEGETKLMIEHLLETAGLPSKTYPPKNAQEVYDLFLVSTGPHVRSIVYYLLLDLCNATAGHSAPASSTSLLQLVHGYQPRSNDGKINPSLPEEFATFFDLSVATRSTIRGFWLLDRQQFDNAAVLLGEFAEVVTRQDHHVLWTLFSHKLFDIALQFTQLRQIALRSTSDMVLYLNVLIANGLTTRAYNFVHDIRDKGNQDKLFHYLFSGCQQMKALSVIMQFPLDSTEEEALSQWLLETSQTVAEPEAVQKLECLVMFLLSRGRFIQAIQLWEQKLYNYPSESRDALMRNYKQLLPLGLRELSEIPHYNNPHVPKTPMRSSRPEKVAATHLVRTPKTAEVLKEAAATIEAQRPERVQEYRSEAFIAPPVTPSRKQKQPSRAAVFCTPRLKVPEVPQNLSPSRGNGFLSPAILRSPATPVMHKPPSSRVVDSILKKKPTDYDAKQASGPTVVFSPDTSPQSVARIPKELRDAAAHQEEEVSDMDESMDEDITFNFGKKKKQPASTANAAPSPFSFSSPLAQGGGPFNMDASLNNSSANIQEEDEEEITFHPRVMASIDAIRHPNKDLKTPPRRVRERPTQSSSLLQMALNAARKKQPSAPATPSGGGDTSTQSLIAGSPGMGEKKEQTPQKSSPIVHIATPETKVDSPSAASILGAPSPGFTPSAPATPLNFSMQDSPAQGTPGSAHQSTRLTPGARISSTLITKSPEPPSASADSPEPPQTKPAVISITPSNVASPAASPFHMGTPAASPFHIQSPMVMGSPSFTRISPNKPATPQPSTPLIQVTTSTSKSFSRYSVPSSPQTPQNPQQRSERVQQLLSTTPGRPRDSPLQLVVASPSDAAMAGTPKTKKVRTKRGTRSTTEVVPLRHGMRLRNSKRTLRKKD